ncbi:MAG TPA: hypothetical protein VK477_04525 [Acidobacteriota bacterium]|nr:hypothetical protein [Acidobacteriota bacterium]
MADQPNTPLTSADFDTCAAFVLDADGIVVASNTSARVFWSDVARPLVTMPFTTLFAADVASQDPEGLAQQWLQLKRDGLDRWTLRVARRLDGSTLEVRLRLERASGGGGSYIATVQPIIRS